jgi:hypothetical protein
LQVQRFWPRAVVIFGGVVVALGWALSSMASSLAFLYVA